MYLDGLNPDAVRVELYAKGIEGAGRTGRDEARAATRRCNPRLRLSRRGVCNPSGERPHRARYRIATA